MILQIGEGDGIFIKSMKMQLFRNDRLLCGGKGSSVSTILLSYVEESGREIWYSLIIARSLGNCFEHAVRHDCRSKDESLPHHLYRSLMGRQRIMQNRAIFTAKLGVISTPWHNII